MATTFLLQKSSDPFGILWLDNTKMHPPLLCPSSTFPRCILSLLYSFLPFLQSSLLQPQSNSFPSSSNPSIQIPQNPAYNNQYLTYYYKADVEGYFPVIGPTDPTKPTPAVAGRFNGTAADLAMKSSGLIYRDLDAKKSIFTFTSFLGNYTYMNMIYYPGNLYQNQPRNDFNAEFYLDQGERLRYNTYGGWFILP